MNLVQVVRHKFFAEKMSVRAIAREMKISRNTVSRYLDDSTIPGLRRGTTPAAQPVREGARKKVAVLLREKQWTAKQRPTSERMVELLGEEGIVASGRTVRRILSEENRKKKEVFIPLLYEAGDLAEVDFFEVHFRIGGETQKGWMFLLRSMKSGRDFGWIYRWQDTACLLDGHLRAFRHFDAVPCRILYDNLRPAARCVRSCSTFDLEGCDDGEVVSRQKWLLAAWGNGLKQLPEKIGFHFDLRECRRQGKIGRAHV